MTDWQAGLMQEATDPGMIGTIDRLAFAGMSLPAAFRRQTLRDVAEPCGTSGTIHPSVIHDFRRCARDEADHPSVRELVALLLRQRPLEPVEAFLDALVTRGLTAEHIYLHLLQPAARRLGEMWLDDTCSFVDVTLAMTVLQGGMRHLEPHFQRHGQPSRSGRTILLTTLGGDQHTFGMIMTAEFFRRAGWTVFTPAAGHAGAVADRLRHERNVVVGFSVSRPDQIPALSDAIRKVRRLGRACVAGVVAGGPVFVTRPDLGRAAGADAVGADARSAVAEAEALAAAGECG